MAQILNSDTTSAAARRSAFEIRMDILRVAAEGCTKPTLIMYQSNTSWVVLRKNLEALIAAGFMIESVIGSRTAYSRYRPTCPRYRPSQVCRPPP